MRRAHELPKVRAPCPEATGRSWPDVLFGKATMGPGETGCRVAGTGGQGGSGGTVKRM